MGEGEYNKMNNQENDIAVISLEQEQNKNIRYVTELELRVEALEIEIKELRSRLKILEARSEMDGWCAR